MTVSISEQAYHKLEQFPGVKSAWVEQLILGSPQPQDSADARLISLEQRIEQLEARIDNHRTFDDGVSHHPAEDTAAPGLDDAIPRAGRGGPGRRRARTPQFRNRVVELRREGHSYKAIMDRLGTGYLTVSKILAEHDLD